MPLPVQTNREVKIIFKKISVKSAILGVHFGTLCPNE